MKVLRRGSIGLLLAMASFACMAHGQDAASVAVPVPTVPVSGVPDAPQVGVSDGLVVPVPDGSPAGPPQFYVPVAGKKNKLQYVGPKDVVELAPTPMLDEEGRQREDPEGKPMFNPAVKQKRDKHGNPTFDEAGKPEMQTASDLGYDDHGKKLKGKKEKAPKTLSVAVERGTLTVDGLTGKAGLNYDIKDFRYLYIYASWVGTTVVSASPFPGATEQKSAFNDKTLTVTVGDHTLQLYSDRRLLGKKPASAYVAIDRNFKLPTAMPVVGYGTTLHAPYAWPGSRENAALTGPVAPPPLPANLRPTLLLSPCPSGEMRLPAKTVLSGGGSSEQPCVAIGSVMASNPGR